MMIFSAPTEVLSQNESSLVQERIRLFLQDLFDLNPDIGKDPFADQARSAISDGMMAVWKQFDQPENRKYYHDFEHTRTVTQRTTDMLTLIRKYNPERVSLHDILIGAVSAANHDRVQGKGIRVNEEESVEACLQAVKDAGQLDTKDAQAIKETIRATIPSFGQDGSVFQVAVRRESGLDQAPPPPLTGVALALADLGSAGMDSPDDYVRQSLGLFVEIHTTTLHTPLSQDQDLPEGEWCAIQEKLQTWANKQQEFIDDRYNHFETELSQIPDESKQQIRNLFIHFKSPETVAALKKFVKEAFQHISTMNQQSFREAVRKN